MQDITPASSARHIAVPTASSRPPRARNTAIQPAFMPLLRYDSWRPLRRHAIKRAKGELPPHVRSGDVSQQFCRRRQNLRDETIKKDHRLSRFRCLIAMSGDPQIRGCRRARLLRDPRPRAETATSDLTQLSAATSSSMALEAEDRADQQQARAEVAERERDELAPVAGSSSTPRVTCRSATPPKALTRAGVKVG